MRRRDPDAASAMECVAAGLLLAACLFTAWLASVIATPIP